MGCCTRRGLVLHRLAWAVAAGWILLHRAGSGLWQRPGPGYGRRRGGGGGAVVSVAPAMGSASGADSPPQARACSSRSLAPVSRLSTVPRDTPAWAAHSPTDTSSRYTVP